MRAVAEVLFELGRLEVVALVVIFVHALIVWHWRQDAHRRWLAAGWLVIFIVLSVAVFWGEMERVGDGEDYVRAHLYEGIWRTDTEALSNMLLRWQNALLPFYLPWLSVWLVGLIIIPILSRLKRRVIVESN